MSAGRRPLILGLGALSVFALVVSAVGTGSALAATVEETAEGNGPVILISLAGGTLSLLLQEALALLQAIVGTITTVVLATAGALGGLQLWANAACAILIGNTVLLTVGTVLLLPLRAERRSH